jgi:hypothetical protein
VFHRPSPTAVLRSAVIAAVFSGVPSTVHALVTGRSPLAAARAAGELLGKPGLVRGLAAHAIISLWWAKVLTAVLPVHRSAWWGAGAGAAAAALDLGIAGRAFPNIARLPRWPQVADHVAFGWLVGATRIVT